jgi:hypothetical protein
MQRSLSQNTNERRQSKASINVPSKLTQNILLVELKAKQPMNTFFNRISILFLMNFKIDMLLLVINA